MAVHGVMIAEAECLGTIASPSQSPTTWEDNMKTGLIAAVTLLSFALISDEAFAAAKKKAAAPAKCTTGQVCGAKCNPSGWCERMVCVGGKWEKRLGGCFGNLCGPKC
jgi:hypothetical protein